MYPPILRVHFQERSVEDFMRSEFNDVYAILFLILIYKSMFGTHLTVHTGCKLKT